MLAMPQPALLGRNGTFVSFRKLHSKVAAFRRFLKANATPAMSEELLAAKMVGRWPSGAPLILAPEQDAPELGSDVQRMNHFSYAEDRSLTGAPVPDTDSAVRDLVVDFFRNHAAEYALRAQLLTDLQQMPIEDASILWPANLSPHQPIGKLTFPAQDPYSPARRVYGDDVLSFNPCIALKNTGHWAPSCAPGPRRMRCQAVFVTR